MSTSSFERRNGLTGPVTTQHCHNIWWNRLGYRHNHPLFKWVSPVTKLILMEEIPKSLNCMTLEFCHTSVDWHLIARILQLLARCIHTEFVKGKLVSFWGWWSRSVFTEKDKKQPTNKKPPIYDSGCGICIIFKSHMYNYETNLILEKEHNLSFLIIMRPLHRVL